MSNNANSTSSAMGNDDLTTLAEQSGFRRTGRTDEVARLCEAFVQRWPEAVQVIEFGCSGEGRTMLALLVSRADPRTVPVLMLQAGIHPGESDGKDAGFIALRELLRGTAAPDALERIAILFVPAFNTDGHERFGQWNRPNQNGPEETGWRTTARNLNLNRDYTKADSPEMQALLRLITEWDPLVCADFHVTDGADFEPDISIQVEPINQGDPQLRASGVQLRDALIAKLAAQGSLPLHFYPDLAKTDDPASGFQLTVYSPRFSTGYFPQRNRFTALVETHSWKNYADRVRATRNTIVGLAELVAAHGATWQEATRRADTEAAQLGGSEVILDYASGWREPMQVGLAAEESNAAGARIIEFRGYAYTRNRSPISGDLVTVYDPTTPQIWRVPLREHVQASLTSAAPRGGYIVPAGYAQEIGAKLALHGIGFECLDRALASVSAAAFCATRAEFSSSPFEGHMRATLQGAWREEQHDVPVRSLFVPIAQPLARLIMALLEPQAPDSFAAWGFFNACFEQKEQCEPYVAERIAKEVLEANPELKNGFARKLVEDSAFASDPNARLEYFLRRHGSWDGRYMLYPVLRIESSELF
jgi:hypothetical protein